MSSSPIMTHSSSSKPKPLRWVLLPLAVLIAASPFIAMPSVEGTVTRAVPFQHRLHVSKDWSRQGADGVFDFPEHSRDCQGCHDFSQPDRPWKNVCISCHVHNVRGEGIQVEPRTPRDSLFDHGDHGGVDCRSCHTPDDLLGERRQIPVPSANYCGRCHDPSRRDALPPAMQEQAAAAQQRFIETLNQRMLTRNGGDSDKAGGTSRFSHATHLTAEQLASDDPTPCLACHSSMKVAHAKNIHEKQFSTDNCNDSCHVGQQVVTHVVDRASVTAGTFVHFYHLGNLDRPSDENNQGLEQKLCRTCHEFHGAAPSSVAAVERPDEFKLTSILTAPPTGEKGPSMCMSCHFHKEWGVTRHGQFDACGECHDTTEGFGGTANLTASNNRPTVSVKRPTSVSFAGGTHKHPFITGNDDTQLCTQQCHIPSEVLPARTEEQVFDHSAHLPPPPDDPRQRRSYSAEYCEGCHTDVRLAPDSSELPSNFNDQQCSECHVGRELAKDVQWIDREVPKFSHLRHLQGRLPDGRRPDCLDCHTPPNGKLGEVGHDLSPAITNCTQCHSHAQHPQLTGGLSTQEVQSCDQCHLVNVSPGKPVATQRLTVVSLQGLRRHSSDDNCADCHDPNAAMVENYVSHVFGDPGDRAPHNEFSVAPGDANWHDCSACDPSNPKRHAANDKVFFEQSAYCIDCHWANFDLPQKRRKQWQAQPYSSNAREHKIRQEWGAKLEGKSYSFPGIPPKK